MPPQTGPPGVLRSVPLSQGPPQASKGLSSHPTRINLSQHIPDTSLATWGAVLAPHDGHSDGSVGPRGASPVAGVAHGSVSVGGSEGEISRIKNA